MLAQGQANRLNTMVTRIAARPQRRRDRGEVEHQREREGRAGAECRQQHAAERRPHRAAGVAAHDVERGRRAHAPRAHRLADQQPPHRMIGRPADAAEEASQRRVPDLELAERIGGHQHGDCEGVDEKHGEQRAAPGHAIGEHADEGAEQPHRQQPQQRHRRHQEGGARRVEHHDGDDEHFQPSRDRHRQADEPEAPEVRHGEHPAPRWRLQRFHPMRVSRQLRSGPRRLQPGLPTRAADDRTGTSHTNGPIE
jgi:hypothetical protein